MLKIRIIAVGKHKDRWVEQGCAHFEKLLARFATVEWRVLSPVKAPSSLPPSEIKKKEAGPLIKESQKGITIALSDRGEQKDTPAFALMLEKLLIKCGGVMNFIIGGAYGLDTDILKKADYVVSLSPLTFSHQLVRLVLLEQLYRAFSILQGTDYHK